MTEIDLFLNFTEVFLGHTTNGANPIIGNILKSCSGFNSAIRIAYLRIIYPATYVTNVLFHN